MRTLIVALALLAGCATANTTLLGPTFKPITQSDVQVVGDNHDLPSEECVTVAAITTKDLVLNDRDKMMRKLKSEAAKLGANYLVFRGYEGEWYDKGTASATAYHCDTAESS